MCCKQKFHQFRQTFLQSLLKNFNITNLSNCVDIPLNYQNDAEVEVKEVYFEKNAQGYADVLHGKFIVHAHRDHKEPEVIITFYKCAKGSEGICTENPSEFIENVSCARLHSDKTGPWYMYAPAIDKRNPCVEVMGEYDLLGAKIEGQYIEKYMTVEEGHYR